MGKQVNFYMAGCDEEEFMRFVRSDRAVGILVDQVPSDDMAPFDQLPHRDVRCWFLLSLWDRDNSPRPLLRYVPTQKHYVVDRLVSEVIELSRSYLEKDRLVRGRIWAEMSVLQSNGTYRSKSESFKKWFNRLANWIRRNSVRDRCGDYVLPGAAAYAKQGGRLVQAVFANTVKLIHHELSEPDPDHPRQ